MHTHIHMIPQLLLPEERYSTVNFSQVSQQKWMSGNQLEHTFLFTVKTQGLFDMVLLNDLELFLMFPLLTTTDATFRATSSAKWTAYPMLTFIQLFLS